MLKQSKIECFFIVVINQLIIVNGTLNTEKYRMKKITKK